MVSKISSKSANFDRRYYKKHFGLLFLDIVYSVCFIKRASKAVDCSDCLLLRANLSN